MELAARTAAWAKSETPLPSGHIHFDGASFIDTGVIVNIGWIVEVELMTVGSAGTVFNAQNSGSFGLAVTGQVTYGNGRSNLSGNLQRTRCVARIGSFGITVDGEIPSSFYWAGENTFTSIIVPSMFIGARNLRGNADNFSVLDLWGFKVWNADGELVRDLKAYTDGTVVGLIDADGTVYTGKGSGTITFVED